MPEHNTGETIAMYPSKSFTNDLQINKYQY